MTEGPERWPGVRVAIRQRLAIRQRKLVLRLRQGLEFKDYTILVDLQGRQGRQEGQEGLRQGKARFGITFIRN